MRCIAGLIIAALAPILVNCSTHPLIDDVTRTTTYDIVEKMRCEAKRAINDHARRLKDDSTIAYEFTFNITEVNDASGEVTWTHPFLTGGNFSLTAKGGLDRSRQTVRNFRIVDTFGELRKTNCSPEELEKNWTYPIAGDVGVYEVVATFAKLHSAEHPVGQEKFDSFHDKLNFTTELSGGVLPTLNLSPVTNRFRVTQAKANLNASRKDIHEVVIALVSGAEAAGVRRSRSIRTVGGTPNNISNQNVLSTTLLQMGGDPRQRALYELDRARILALQERTLNQVVGP